MQHVLAALGKDSLAFVAADEFPLPYEYRFIRLEGLVTEPPEDLCERVLVFLDCGNIDRTQRGRAQARGPPDPQHRPPPRQHALRDGQPRRRQRLVHGGDGVGPDAGARRGARRRRSARRSTSAWSPTPGRFMYENTGPRAHEMAAALLDGGVDGARRSTAASTRACRRASSSCSRAGSARRALRRRAADRHAPHARGLPRHGRRRELLRGRRRPPALGRGHRGGRARARPADGRDAARARCRCAPPTTASTSRGSPARWAAAGTGAPPASRPTSTSRSWSRSCAPSSRGSFDGPPDGVILVRQAGRDHVARRGGARRGGGSGRGVEGRPRRHAGPVRHRAAARAGRAARRACSGS